ncbi:MAG: C4-dicarboxylate transporter, DcuC family [Blastocatellia bacterium]|jgi:DcuC family C4-dicarboxylate transporter|nr:C4-dicarboxylate transporter, DcuC family [Blastocatellia bacterium]
MTNLKNENYKTLFGILVAVATFICIAFEIIEARLGLLAGAMLMFLISGSPVTWFRKFVETMGRTEFLKVILPVFAFTAVAKATGCSDAFVNVLASPLSRWGSFLVPVVILVAFVTNMALVSATASSLAVGVVFIPIFQRAGIDPALAGAAILAGSWGAVLSPGSKHAALIADAANESQRHKKDARQVDAMDVVRGHAPVVVSVLLVVTGLMWAQTTFFRQSRPPTVDRASVVIGVAIWLRAFVPLIPLVLLWVLPRIRNDAVSKLFPKELLVLQMMFLGIVVAVIVGTVPVTQNTSAAVIKSSVPAPQAQATVSTGPSTTPTPAPTPTTPEPHGKKLAETIFEKDGMANGYGAVLTIIISAMVFVAGLKELGVLAGLISLLTRQRRSAAWFAVFGDMAFAALSGSGDAASCSFNLGVTPSANKIGERPRELGSMAWLGAEMGRCFSPVAAATLSVARNFNVLPINIVKWSVIPIALGGFVAVLLRRKITG